jgi:hypothetical protein
MVAGLDDLVRIADPNADAIGNWLDLRRLGSAVAGDAAELEADPELAASRTAIAGREITEDAMVDANALGVDVDRLCDVQRGVGAHLDIAREERDAFFRRCCRGGNSQRNQDGQRGQETLHGQATGRSNDTLGAVWMDVSESS